MSIRSDLRRAAADAGVHIDNDYPGYHEWEFRYFHGVFFIIAFNRLENKRNPKLPIEYEDVRILSAILG